MTLTLLFIYELANARSYVGCTHTQEALVRNVTSKCIGTRMIKALVRYMAINKISVI